MYYTSCQLMASYLYSSTFSIEKEKTELQERWRSRWKLTTPRFQKIFLLNMKKMLEKLNGLVRSKSGSQGNRNIHTFAKRGYVIQRIRYLGDERTSKVLNSRANQRLTIPEASHHHMEVHLGTARFWKGSEREEGYITLLTAGIEKKMDRKKPQKTKIHRRVIPK